jgi:hypothetical protein
MNTFKFCKTLAAMGIGQIDISDGGFDWKLGRLFANGQMFGVRTLSGWAYRAESVEVKSARIGELIFKALEAYPMAKGWDSKGHFDCDCVQWNWGIGPVGVWEDQFAKGWSIDLFFVRIHWINC